MLKRKRADKDLNEFDKDDKYYWSEKEEKVKYIKVCVEPLPHLSDFEKWLLG